MTNTKTLTLTDVHDMVVVHRVFRREFRLIPELVRQVQPGDTDRATVIADHARLVLTGLHGHHTGEDELLWPKLLERAAPDAELIHRMEAQHERVAEAIDRIEPALDRWQAEARPAVTEEVASAFDALRTALLEHLADEEEHILPLAARHVSQAEWDELGEHGVGETKKKDLPILFGAIAEEATPEEMVQILGTVPPPVRILARTLFAWQYRRYVNRVRNGR
jgi:iron-sulfur cluster repair protein YtfE (RIC family)